MGLQVIDEDLADIWPMFPFQGQMLCQKTEVPRMTLSEAEEEGGRAMDQVQKTLHDIQLFLTSRQDNSTEKRMECFKSEVF